LRLLTSYRYTGWRKSHLILDVKHIDARFKWLLLYAILQQRICVPIQMIM
jgi:hypothetical protein